jgi:hypothetical protein
MNESIHGLPAFHFAAGAANAPPGAPPGAPAPPGEATIPTPPRPSNPAPDAGLSGESKKKHISRRGEFTPARRGRVRREEGKINEKGPSGPRYRYGFNSTGAAIANNCNHGLAPLIPESYGLRPSFRHANPIDRTCLAG